jgi:hypothetical protein
MTISNRERVGRALDYLKEGLYPFVWREMKATYGDKWLAAGNLLRMEALDKYLWREANHIDLQHLWEYLAQYLYLPRLKNPDVLLRSVKEGLASMLVNENFAYAEGWDEQEQRYLHLVVFRSITPSLSRQNLLVKPEVAHQQLEAEKPISLNRTTEDGSVITESRYPQPPSTVKGSNDSQESTPVLRRFYGSVEIDPLRINRDAPAIANEIIQHLTRLKGATVKIVLEIEADVPDGVPDDVVRTVTENCRTLKFNTHGFEQE